MSELVGNEGFMDIGVKLIGVGGLKDLIDDWL